MKRMKLKKKRYLLCIFIIIYQNSILSAFPVTTSQSPATFNSTNNEIVFNKDHHLHRIRRATNFCYQTEKGDRDVEKPTVEACVKHCWYLRKHIALIRQGMMCTCLPVLQDATKVEMSECDKPCTGNKKQNCGGDVSYAAYETGYVEEPKFRGKLYYSYSIMRNIMRQGCFKYKGGRLEFRTARMYPVLCVSMCFKYKYNLAGVFQGEGCMCIPSLNKMKRISDKKCQLKCPGGSLLKCGGRKKETIVFKTQGRFGRGDRVRKSQFTPPNWLVPKQVGPHDYDYFKGGTKGKASALTAKPDKKDEEDVNEYDDINPDTDFSKQRKVKKGERKVEKLKPVKPKVKPEVESFNLGNAQPQNRLARVGDSGGGDAEVQGFVGGGSNRHSGYNNRGQRRGRNGHFRQNRRRRGRRFRNNRRRFGRNGRRNKGMNRGFGNGMRNRNRNHNVESKPVAKTIELSGKDEEEKKTVTKSRGKRNGDNSGNKRRGRRRRRRRRRRKRRRKGRRRRRKGKQGTGKNPKKKSKAKKDAKGKSKSKLASLKIGNKTIGDSVSVKEVGKMVKKASSADPNVLGPVIGGVVFVVLFICICSSWRKAKAAEKKKQAEEEEMRRKKRRKKRKKKKKKKEKEAAEEADAEAEEEG